LKLPGERRRRSRLGGTILRSRRRVNQRGQLLRGDERASPGWKASNPRVNYDQVQRVPPPLTRLLVKAFDGQIKSQPPGLPFKDSAAGRRQLARRFAADKSRLGTGNRNYEIIPIDFCAPDARARTPPPTLALEGEDALGAAT